MNNETSNKAENQKTGTYAYINATDAMQKDVNFALQCLATVDSDAMEYEKNHFYTLLARHHGGNKEIMMACVKNKGALIRFGTKEVLLDREIALAALNNDPYVYTLTLNNVENFKHLCDFYPDDEDMAAIALRNNENVFNVVNHLNSPLKNNRVFILTALSIDGTVLSVAPDCFKDDKEAVKIAVTENGNAIEFASERMQMDKDIAILAVRSNAQAYIPLPEEMKSDYDIAYEALSTAGYLMHYAPDSIKHSRPHIRAALNAWVYCYQDLDKELQADKEIFEFVFARNKEIVLDALQENDLMRNTKHIMLDIVRWDHDAFSYCSEQLQNDNDIKKIINS